MIKKILKKIISYTNYALVSKTAVFNFKTEIFKEKLDGSRLTNDKSIENFLAYIFLNKEKTSSQIFQDLFVDYMLSKSAGFFCEVGACDGIVHSNTFWLEKKKNWTGILCEPSIQWQNKLKLNRPNSIIVKEPIYSVSHKEIDFVDIKGGRSFLNYKNQNINLDDDKKKVKLKTINLNDLFKKNKVNEIDYLSLDTEGSEYDILESIDFKLYAPKIITIEHNYNPIKRKQIFKLMTKEGYKRYFPFISRFDDWYVKEIK